MSKINSLLENTKGQLDTNLAVNAILGLILAAAFLVIVIIIIQGVVDGANIVISEGDVFHSAFEFVKNNIVSSIVMATLLIGGPFAAICMLLLGAMKRFRD